jgi:uncharacterized membrane protein
VVSELYVVGYRDLATAEQVRDRMIQMQSEQLVTLDDIVVVENRSGKIKMHQARSMAGMGAASGALWGGLIGLLFFMPLMGMAIGAAAGAAGGAMTDIGVDDKFMKDLGTTLQPGVAAVFALVSKATTDRVIAELAPYEGRLLHTSLSAEAEAQLREAIAKARAVPAHR